MAGLKALEQWGGTVLASAISAGGIYSERRRIRAGAIPLYLFVEASCAGVTGGAATSDITLAGFLNPLDINGGYNLQIKEVGSAAPNLTADLTTDNAAPADVTKMFFAISIPGSAASAAYPNPLMGYVMLRLHNASTVFTAGTVTYNCTLVGED